MVTVQLFGMGVFQFFAGGCHHPPVAPLPVGVSPEGTLWADRKIEIDPFGIGFYYQNLYCTPIPKTANGNFLSGVNQVPL